MATGFRQHLRQMLGRSIPKYHRRVFDTYVGAPAIMVCYPEDAVLVDDERIDLMLCLDNAVRLTDQFHEPIAESLRAAANVVTTTQEIGCLRDRIACCVVLGNGWHCRQEQQPSFCCKMLGVHPPDLIETKRRGSGVATGFDLAQCLTVPPSAIV
jgi:hypothetical protein